jgi:hypothetical protein
LLIVAQYKAVFNSWISQAVPSVPAGSGPTSGGQVLGQTQDIEEIIEWVAALHIGKVGAVCVCGFSDEDRLGRATVGGGELLHDGPLARSSWRCRGPSGFYATVQQAP